MKLAFFSSYLPRCVSCVWVPFCLSVTVCVLIRASLFFALIAGPVTHVSIKHGGFGMLTSHQPKTLVFDNLWMIVSNQLGFSRITKHDLKMMCKTLKHGHLCFYFAEITNCAFMEKKTFVTQVNNLSDLTVFWPKTILKTLYTASDWQLIPIRLQYCG